MATPPGQRKQRLIEDTQPRGTTASTTAGTSFRYVRHGLCAGPRSRLERCPGISPDYIYAPPAASLREIAAHIAARLGKSGIRYCGDPDLQRSARYHSIGVVLGAIDILKRAKQARLRRRADRRGRGMERPGIRPGHRRGDDHRRTLRHRNTRHAGLLRVARRRACLTCGSSISTPSTRTVSHNEESCRFTATQFSNPPEQRGI